MRFLPKKVKLMLRDIVIIFVFAVLSVYFQGSLASMCPEGAEDLEGLGTRDVFYALNNVCLNVPCCM